VFPLAIPSRAQRDRAPQSSGAFGASSCFAKGAEFGEADDSSMESHVERHHTVD